MIRAASSTLARPVPGDYLRLVRTFPLRPLRTAEEYEAAGKVLNRLLGRPGGELTEGERDYVQAMARFVEDYDQVHSHFVTARRTPLETLRYLVEQSGLTVSDLGRILGMSHSAASMILRGRRGISKAAAKTLAEHFRVDVGVFL